jgi:hypothetical protein
VSAQDEAERLIPALRTTLEAVGTNVVTSELSEDIHIPDIPDMTALDTCDRCGPSVQAHVATLIRGTWLLFCAHHYAQHETALAVVTEKVVDERGRLTPEPTHRV